MIETASYRQKKVSSWAAVMMVFGILTLSGYTSSTPYQQQPANQVGVVLSEYSAEVSPKTSYQDAFQLVTEPESCSDNGAHQVLHLLRIHDRSSRLKLAVITQRFNHATIPNFSVPLKVTPPTSDEPHISSLIG